jgi:hypothetical protein
MNMETEITALQKDMEYVKERLDEIVDKLDTKYVTKDEFAPIRALVYGCASIMLTAVVGSLVYLVIK